MLGRKAKKALKMLLSLTDDEREAIISELGDAEEEEEETAAAEEEATGGEAQAESPENTEPEAEGEEDTTEQRDFEEVEAIAGNGEEAAEEAEAEEQSAPVDAAAAPETAEGIVQNSVEPDARLIAVEEAIKEIKETLKALSRRMGEEAEGEESFGLGATVGDDRAIVENKLDAVRRKYFGF